MREWANQMWNESYHVVIRRMRARKARTADASDKAVRGSILSPTTTSKPDKRTK